MSEAMKTYRTNFPYLEDKIKDILEPHTPSEKEKELAKDLKYILEQYDGLAEDFDNAEIVVQIAPGGGVYTMRKDDDHPQLRYKTI